MESKTFNLQLVDGTLFYNGLEVSSSTQKIYGASGFYSVVSEYKTTLKSGNSLKSSSLQDLLVLIDNSPFHYDLEVFDFKDFVEFKHPLFEDYFVIYNKSDNAISGSNSDININFDFLFMVVENLSINGLYVRGG